MVVQRAARAGHHSFEPSKHTNRESEVLLDRHTTQSYSHGMKIAISVPDELWNQALSTSRVGQSPSAVVQDALRKVTEPLLTRCLDDDTSALFEAARQKVAASAQKSFGIGYRAGIRLASEVGDWTRLRQIVQRGLVNTLEQESERLLRLRAAGGRAFEEHGSVFVLDKRRGDVSTVEAGEDQEGEWFLDHDPDALWLQFFTIDTDGSVFNMTPGDVPPLLVRGTEAALRDVLEQATP
jgi:hypothetical protein